MSGDPLGDGLFDAIRAAHAGIRPQVRVTLLERSHGLSTELGCEVHLKCEHLQETGSFKFRGATNRLRGLDERQRAAGVTTASTGNHGLGVARAGQLAGIRVTVYLGNETKPERIEAIRSRGADVVMVDGPPGLAEQTARAAAEREGKVYVPPYNDLAVIAGQGTLGVEIHEQLPDVDAVFVTVGGGGLISGVGTALKHLDPRIEVVGVWPENSTCMLAALDAGEIVDVVERDTLSDSTAGAIEAGSVTFPICRRVIDTRIVVTEAEIAAAMRRVAATDHWMVEGAAGVALAGLAKEADRYRGKTVAVVLCGRNIALDTYLAAVGG